MWKKIDPKDIAGNPFAMIREQWMLITAGTKEHYNTMTASRGAFGVFWSKPCATIYVRESRYTREFLDANEYFTLCFFGEEYRQKLQLCGSKSGRDVDKVKECGFTVAEGEGGAPYFEEASLVLVCRKRYAHKMDVADIPADAMETFYSQPGKPDLHYIYTGEIVEVLSK